MFRWLILLSAIALCCAVPCSHADSYELHPAAASAVINGQWGDRPGEFSWPGDMWGVGEVGRFGPFAIDASGRFYLADLVRNEVKVFERDGSFVEAVPMLQEPNLVDDLAVYDGVIYWFGETPWGIRVLGVRPGSSELIEVELTDDPILTHRADGLRITGNCRLVAGSGGREMYVRMAGVSIPLVTGGRVVPADEQMHAKRHGLRTASGAGVAFSRESGATLSGERVDPGDIVRVLPDGRIEGVLAKNTGSPWGVTGHYLLHPDSRTVEGQYSSYFILRDETGQVISRTRMPRRGCTRGIDIDNRFRLAPDGSFYELYVNDDGVHVVRWQ